jgi:CDGSH-type Zn-finger protein
VLRSSALRPESGAQQSTGKNMADPKVAARAPARVQLEAGKTYLWCRCGESKNQPFCDGSHKATEFTPMEFVAERTGDAWLCQCKRTCKAPHCDGTHKRT